MKGVAPAVSAARFKKRRRSTVASFCSICSRPLPSFSIRIPAAVLSRSALGAREPDRVFVTEHSVSHRSGRRPARRGSCRGSTARPLRAERHTLRVMWGVAKPSARSGYVAVAGFLAVTLASSAFAHRADLINGGRAGPIRNGKTTLSDAEDRFGRADNVKRVVVGCDVRLKRARWNGRLVVFFGRGADGTATETRVLRRTLRSDEGRDIVVHTRKGLRIGSTLRKLRRLYPDAQRYRSKNRNWYILKSSPSFGRLEAAVKKRRVVILRNGPWEYC